jgi:hypothetical protein
MVRDAISGLTCRSCAYRGRTELTHGFRIRTPQIPKVVVKKEPGSPEVATARHRPRRLDLSTPSASSAGPGALSARPLTSKDSAGLAIQDVGLACLSPGFNTQDPTMQQQLQRSMSVRDQQRLIIEARAKGQKVPTDMDQPRHPDSALFRPNKTPNTSRRKGPPPALSIAPPAHSQFANERVIQSAPLGQSFTGLARHPDGTMGRVNQPSNLSHSSHIHHVPAIQTSNRLPPISDVFPGEMHSTSHPTYPQTARVPHFRHSPGHSSQSNHPPPLPSPGYPQHFSQGHKQASQQPTRPEIRREYKSAEDALNNLTGGREDLRPRIVHYGGRQPPTPPSPAPHKSVGLGVTTDTQRSSAPGSSSRRRDRDEYERDNGSPPLGRGPVTSRRTGPFGAGRDSPETQAAKREEFLKICERAWDLFHS